MKQNLHQPLDVAKGLDHLLTDLPSEVIVLHSPSGIIHYVSHLGALIFGASSSLVGRSLIDRFHADDQERVRKTFSEAALNAATVPPMTVRVVGDGGEIRWVVLFTVAVKDGAGKVIELHSTMRDVTQQIQLRDRIVEYDTLAFTTNELAKVGGWYHDIDTGVTYWTDELRAMYEVDEQFVPTGDSIRGFFTQEDFDRMINAMSLASTSEQPSVLEVPAHLSGRRIKWMRVFFSVDRREGNASRIYGATQDITEIKEREQELERLVRELTHQRDRLEEFSHLVSHQLRAPLTNLTSLVSLLRDTTDDDERLKLENTMIDAVGGLERTLEEIGEAVRIRNMIAPKHEKIYVRDLVLSVKAQLAQSIRDSEATIEIDTDDVPVVEYPAVYLESILRHLVSNALRFANPDRSPVVSVATYLDDDHDIVLEVKDNGLGIDLRRHADRMFRLGSTFHRSSSGRGVGLFMVKTMVESLGGEISIQSSPSEGTIFTIALHKHRAEEVE